MKPISRWMLLIAPAFLLAGISACSQSNAVGRNDKTPDEQPAQAKSHKPFTRLFVQDLKTSSVKWADVRTDEKLEFSLDALSAVKGFKELDPAKQKLVQMKESGGLVCVGVRDDEEGAFESGWVLIRTGVSYIDHGDHGHWTFKKNPSVADSRLDKKQGNPAHLYQPNRPEKTRVHRTHSVEPTASLLQTRHGSNSPTGATRMPWC